MMTDYGGTHKNANPRESMSPKPKARETWHPRVGIFMCSSIEVVIFYIISKLHKKFFIKNKYVVLTHSFIQIHLRFKSSRIEIFIVTLSDLNDISNLIKNLLLFY